MGFCDRKMPANAVTLYAKWVANQYSVEFSVNDGAGTMPSQAFVYDTAQTLETNKFTKEGYTFKGCSTTADGQVVYTDGASVYNLTSTNNGTVTLYAVWEANAYSVEFHANGGTGTMPPQAFIYDTAQALEVNRFTKEGYTFKGWSTTADGQIVYTDGASVNNLTSTNHGTVTLYAVWEANQYTVTFKDWDGSVLKTEQVAYHTAATAPTDPTRDGYRFTGWDVAFDNIMGDTVVTAQYEKEEVIVPPTEPEQPRTSGQGGEMNNTETEEKTQTGTNLEAAKTGDDSIVELLLATGGISSIAAAIAFFFRKKKKSEV